MVAFSHTKTRTKSATIESLTPIVQLARRGYHGSRGFVRGVAQTPAQGARPDARSVGRESWLFSGDDPEGRSRRAPPLAPDRRTAGAAPSDTSCRARHVSEGCPRRTAGRSVG